MIRHYIIVVFTLALLSLKGQNSIATYSFINYNENKLIYDKDSSDFLKLFKKLDGLNKGELKEITIAHIGGSHVQGGVWSNTFLENLKENFKTEGTGYFIFPYRMGKTNGQPYASSFTTGKWKKCRCVKKEFCLPLGMNGMSVSSNDSSNAFGIIMTDKAVCKQFNSVKVYHNFNSSFSFSCTVKSEREDFKDKGYSLFVFDELIDSVNFSLNRIDTLQKDFTLFGFSIENKTVKGFYLAGLGANGAASNSFLRCDYFIPQLKTIKPDLVIISLGVNDVQGKGFTKADFRHNYDSLIHMVEQASPDCAILLTTTTDNYIKRRTPNKRTALAREALLEVIQEHHLAVWDMYTVMGGFKSIYKWGRVGLASKDRVHFSPKGYKILGTLMFEALYKSYLYNSKISNK